MSIECTDKGHVVWQTIGAIGLGEDSEACLQASQEFVATSNVAFELCHGALIVDASLLEFGELLLDKEGTFVRKDAAGKAVSSASAVPKLVMEKKVSKHSEEHRRQRAALCDATRRFENRKAFAMQRQDVKVAFIKQHD